MEIRTATMEDLGAISALEAVCFPPAEAASEAAIAARLRRYPDHFWLLWEGERLLSFVNGMVTDQPDLTDEMYADAGLHREDGRWQMIFGVVTDPAFQGRGLASHVMRRVIRDAQAQGREGVVLTCKERLRGFYARFGFVDEGVSASEHGGVVWHQMRLRLDPRD